MFWHHARTARTSRSFAHRGTIARRLFLEGLENRRLLATLTVTGTAGNDAISAWVAGDLLNVNVNGATFSVPNSAFDRIRILGVGGDDRIKLDTTVMQVADLDGGDGNDSITAGDR